MIRKPLVADQFYEGTEKKLIEQINNCFTSAFGPGPISQSKKKKEIIRGAIVPHAGYFFSGACAAHVYKRIAESELPNVFLIIGASHAGFETCLSEKDWATPLGIVKNDAGFTAKLKAEGIAVDERAHESEHSIEVQLPFLQFIVKDPDKLRVVPLMINHGADYKEIGRKIKKAVAEYESEGKRVCVLASSDFTHYGYNYGYVPFRNKVKESIQKLDYTAIDKIKNIDSDGFIRFVNEKQATICGAYAIAVLLESLSNTKEVKLLKYYTSGDIVKDYNTSVSYACLIFK